MSPVIMVYSVCYSKSTETEVPALVIYFAILQLKTTVIPQRGFNNPRFYKGYLGHNLHLTIELIDPELSGVVLTGCWRGGGWQTVGRYSGNF